MGNWKDSEEKNNYDKDLEEYEEYDFVMNDHKDSEGCYIATCVYGSYDCPQVWILRRFRDNFLKPHFWGRCFIRCYYFLSPPLVRFFGNNLLFKNLFHFLLDPFVSVLKRNGISDSPYLDLN